MLSLRKKKKGWSSVFLLVVFMLLSSPQANAKEDSWGGVAKQFVSSQIIARSIIAVSEPLLSYVVPKIEGFFVSRWYKGKVVSLDISCETKEKIVEEVEKLAFLSAKSDEMGRIKEYINLILGLPWGKVTQDNLDLSHARKVLDEDHYGLDEIKEKILDFIAMKKLNPDAPAPILCFVGSPGTGKTSLVNSIANCLERKCCRISLGGMKDEAEIRGSLRSSSGALPGRFIQEIHKLGSCNPVVLLDEIDKVAGSVQNGNASAALLEILDPEQNKSFQDRYLAFPFDFSKAIFVATANSLDDIPAPLRDRMEIIHLDGYTAGEKKEIAKKHLVEKIRKDAGLSPEQLNLSDDIIEEIVSVYAKGPGVRQLGRAIRTLCAKVARSVVENDQPVVFTKENLAMYLGPQ